MKRNGENLDRLFRLVKSTSVLIKAGKSSYFFLMFFSQFTHLIAFLHCFWARRWYFETGPDWYVNCISCQKIVFLSQDTLQAEFIYYFFLCRMKRIKCITKTWTDASQSTRRTRASSPETATITICSRSGRGRNLNHTGLRSNKQSPYPA